MILIGAFAVPASAGEYSPWTASKEYPSIEYRVKHERVNEFLAKENKPANAWCVELRHAYTSPLQVSWTMTDHAITSQPPRTSTWASAWRGVTLSPSATHEACGHYLTTTSGGTVRVWLDKVVVDGAAVSPTPPPCDPGAVTAKVRLSAGGETLAITVTRGADTMILTRKTLLALRHPATAQPGAPNSGESRFYLGGKGSPSISLAELAQAYCHPTTAVTLSEETTRALRAQLAKEVTEATKVVCSKNRQPAKCEAAIGKSTHVSEGVRN